MIINLAIIIIPFLFLFDKRIKYYKKLKPLILSIIIVGGIFVIWDSIFTSFEIWSFNKEHVIGLKIFGLPVEEILFFITVPYSCIFIYESLEYFLKDKEFNYKKMLCLFSGLLFLLLSIIFFQKTYTFIIFLLTSIFSFISWRFLHNFLRSSNYWKYIGISFVFFFIFNHFLTSIPVVEYNSKEITGIRIWKIPIEDFFYNYLMLSCYLFVYLAFKKNPEIGSKNEEKN
jgi:lycopene cyclase domain-containing protein